METYPPRPELTYTEPTNTHVARVLSYHPDCEYKHRKMIEQYLKDCDEATQSKKVTYGPAEHGIGRAYAKHSLSLQGMSKKVRHTICEEFPAKLSPGQHEVVGRVGVKSILHDIDIENAHYSFLQSLCKANCWSSPNVDHYVSKREEVLVILQQDFRITREEAKRLLCKLLYGGSVNYWIEKNKIIHSASSKALNYCLSLESELKCLRENVWGFFGNHEKVAAKKNPKASLMSLVLQEMEHNILMCMVDFFEMKGWQVASLVFDGLMLYRKVEDGIEEKVSNDLLLECQEYVFSSQEWNIKLAEKEMKEVIPLNAFSSKSSFLTNFMTHVRASGRYIKDDLSNLINLDKNQWLLIKSPTGTGKTKYLEHAFRQIETCFPSKKLLFVAVSPRCSVTDQHHKTFKALGFEHYKKADMTEANKIITTLDTIVKLDRPIDVLYIDEVESLLRHMFSKTLKHPREVWQKLVRACSFAKHVICTDADMGDMTSTFFGHLFNSIILNPSEYLRQKHEVSGAANGQYTSHSEFSIKERALFLENCLQPVKLKVSITLKRHLWFHELEQRLKDVGSKIFIGCDSCKSAQVLQKQILEWAEKHKKTISAAQALTPEKVKLYTSKNGDSRDFRNVDKAWEKIKIVLCSPSVIYGLDYSNPTSPFTGVMGFYTCQGMTMGADEIRQQMRRIRNIVRVSEQQWDVCIYCSPDRPMQFELPTDPEKITLCLKEFYESYNRTFAKNGGESSFLLENLPTTTDSFGKVNLDENNTFVKLYVQYLRKRNLSKNRLVQMLLYIFTLEEHDVKILSEPLSDTNAVDELWSKLGHLIKEIKEEQEKEFSDIFDQISSLAVLEFSSNIFDIPKTLKLDDKTKGKLEQTVKVLQEVLLCPQTNPEIIKGNNFLFSLLSSEKDLCNFLRFRRLCKRFQHIEPDDMEAKHFQFVSLTQSDISLLNILHHVEESVLQLQRGECLFFTETKVRSWASVKVELSEDTKRLISNLSKLPAGETLKIDFISKGATLYDVYRWTCQMYMKFCQNTKNPLIKGTSIPLIPYISNGKRDTEGDKEKRVCNCCGIMLKKDEFHVGKSVCKRCRQKITIYSFTGAAAATLVNYTELIIRIQCSKFKAAEASFRLDEPILKTLMQAPSNLHTVWNTGPAKKLSDIKPSSLLLLQEEEDF